MGLHSFGCEKAYVGEGIDIQHQLTRRNVVAAKSALYRALLQIDIEEISDWDLDIMTRLARDPDIKKVLDGYFSKGCK